MPLSLALLFVLQTPPAQPAPKVQPAPLEEDGAPTPAASVDLRLQRLTRALQLREDQVPQVRQALEAQNRGLEPSDRSRDNPRARVRLLRERRRAFVDTLHQILSEDQWRRFQALRTRQRDRRRQGPMQDAPSGG